MTSLHSIVGSPHGLAGADPFLKLLEKAGLGRSSLIHVTGPSGLSALLWFCRHGFERVAYLRPGAGPHEPADALVVAHTCDSAALERLLRSGLHLRRGGALILRSPLPAPDQDGADPIHDLLARSGYRVEICVHGARREVHVARRGGGADRQAA